MSHELSHQQDCGCDHGVSRRRVLQAGLAVAAVGAAGKSGDAFAETPAERRSEAQQQTRKAFSAASVRPIDIHSHYFPEEYVRMMNADGKSRGANDPKFTDLKVRIAAMDEQGVAMHALSLTAPMVYWGDEERSHTLARAWNDGAIAAHKSYPDRFVVLATLPMQFPNATMDELNRVSKLPGVRGIYLGTNIAGKDLDDPMFEPVYSRIEALDLPVFLHPLNTVGGERMAKYYLSNFIGNPVDSTIAAAHLIFGGVLDRHPKLNICLPHAGGVVPALIGRWDRGWHVRPEPEIKALPKAPSEYLSRFTYDTISHSKDVMALVIKTVGVERIMLGSDFCFDMGYEQPVKFVDELGLSTTERNMVLGGTAAKLLKV